MLKSPELLLPAGSLDKMRIAYAFGADAVYAGQPRYSLRARNNEFALEQLKTGIAEAHAAGKKFFVASNLMPHNAKVKTYLDDMAPVIAMKPDALIMADPGLIMMVREKWPDIPIHLSVQANTVNYMGVKFWQKIGLTRVILSRELSLDEVAQIRDYCPDMELEVFVHGALCIAYSGRCLLSGPPQVKFAEAIRPCGERCVAFTPTRSPTGWGFIRMCLKPGWSGSGRMPARNS